MFKTDRNSIKNILVNNVTLTHWALVTTLTRMQLALENFELDSLTPTNACPTDYLSGCCPSPKSFFLCHHTEVSEVIKELKVRCLIIKE